MGRFPTVPYPSNFCTSSLQQLRPKSIMSGLALQWNLIPTSGKDTVILSTSPFLVRGHFFIALSPQNHMCRLCFSGRQLMSRKNEGCKTSILCCLYHTVTSLSIRCCMLVLNFVCTRDHLLYELQFRMKMSYIGVQSVLSNFITFRIWPLRGKTRSILYSRSIEVWFLTQGNGGTFFPRLSLFCKGCAQIF